VGSPRGAAFNVFRVSGPDIGGAGDDVIETHLFTVEGKTATTQGAPATPPPPGGGTPPTTRPPATRPPLVPTVPNLPGLAPLPPLFPILGR